MRKGKLRILSGGLIAWYCPGCQCHHHVNDRWAFNGDYDRPTFSPSILVRNPAHTEICHTFVTDGKIQYLSDCTYALAGQTVDLKEDDEEELY